MVSDMVDLNGIKIIFVAGFGPVVRDHKASLAVYGGILDLPLTQMPDDPTYYHVESIEGVKHFALWPLSHAAQSCFGTNHWPQDIDVPQAWLEFDVEDIRAATDTVKAKGVRLLVEARMEPWGQTVTRFISPEGILVGLTDTPWLRRIRRESS
jgi:catechol 2,3-dioxygenase-like lactoylglutathione lyase family enzyme